MDRDPDDVQPGSDLPLLFYSLSASAHFHFISAYLLFLWGVLFVLSVTFTAACAIFTSGLLLVWVRLWPLHSRG